MSVTGLAACVAAGHWASDSHACIHQDLVANVHLVGVSCPSARLFSSALSHALPPCLFVVVMWLKDVCFIVAFLLLYRFLTILTVVIQGDTL